jgi:uncharacterized protein
MVRGSFSACSASVGRHAPGLFRHLKAEVDANRTSNGQFLLTGSQKFTLMKNVSESLAGRADIVELETLSYSEIRSALPDTRVETAIVRVSHEVEVHGIAHIR